MDNKYNLTREENVFLAKRLMVDSIWKSANLEGIAVTFPDTEMIFNGRTLPGYKVDDIIAINNLKRGWYFILDNLDFPIDFAYIAKVNQIIGGDGNVYKAGYLREFDVAIGGTAWKPERPNKEDVKLQIEQLDKSTATTFVINILCYLMRSQLFNDGNKRTAQIVCKEKAKSKNCRKSEIILDWWFHDWGDNKSGLRL